MTNNLKRELKNLPADLLSYSFSFLSVIEVSRGVSRASRDWRKAALSSLSKRTQLTVAGSCFDRGKDQYLLAGRLLSIKDLTFSSSSFTSPATVKFASCLPHFSALERLCLANCDLDDAQMIAIAAVLPSLSCLQIMNFNYTDFGDDGLASLAAI